MSKKCLDFVVYNGGSFWLLKSLTQVAETWIDENIHPDHQKFGGAVVIENCYIEAIIHGIVMDGLIVGAEKECV